jgi:hypothetical protein
MLTAFPPGLDALYRRMIDQICNSKNAKLCKSIPAVASVVYRPITLDEVASFVDMPPRSSSNYRVLAEIIGLCGSFLTLRERTISFVHQSAKDFLIEKAAKEVFLSGIEDEHYNIFSRSLQVMSSTLRRDVYNLRTPGFSLDQVRQPNPDPLAAARCSCLYWVDHLLDCDTGVNNSGDLEDGGSVDKFLCQSYLCWLEALCLIRSLSSGIVMIKKLENRLKVRFPTLSYKDKTVRLWDAATGAALHTLVGHSSGVRSVAFSPDSRQVVSGSYDKKVRLWDAATGAALQTLEGHSGPVSLIAQGGNIPYTLFVLNNWVVEGGSNLVFLPPAYRATCEAVWNNIIVLGHSSGRISILGIKEGSKLI